jgi:PEGA domain
MQPSRQHCLCASLAALLWLFSAPQAQADTLTITSAPSGATVEIDGSVVGITPYHMTVPGGYFHKTHTVFGSRLGHAMLLRVSLEGYTPAQINMTDGPFEWIAITGRREGTYYLLRSNQFSVKLTAAEPGSQTTSRGGSHSTPAQSTRAVIDEAPGRASTEQTSTAEATGTGEVTVRSEPSGADIYVDGKLVGQTPSTLRLASGAHHVEVRRGAHPPWVKDFELLKGSEVTLHATSGEAPDSGTVVNSTDAGDAGDP